jgi:methionyl aminopeptidase
MDDDVREKYVEAGRVAAEALNAAADAVEEGATFAEVAEVAESTARDEGAEPAFPCNVSRNQDAAHDTPGVDDDRVLEAGDLVKIDVGVHVDGYIGDNARTVAVGTNRHGDLEEASREGLRAGLEALEPGVDVETVGAAIERAIESYDVRPIVNLTGHNLERYDQHAGLSIPNVARGSATIEPGTAVAIEPFATDGSGRVKDSEGGNIYRLLEEKPQRSSHAKEVLAHVVEHHDELPFAARWVDEALPDTKVEFGLRILEQADAVKHYPVLREDRDGMVSQHERTALVLDDRVEITTPW